jgi:hypothetical protein
MSRVEGTRTTLIHSLLASPFPSYTHPTPQKFLNGMRMTKAALSRQTPETGVIEGKGESRDLDDLPYVLLLMPVRGSQWTFERNNWWIQYTFS